MKLLIVSLQIVSFILILGCSNKSTYESWQRRDQWQCQKNPTANCENRKSYEEYKSERGKLIKEENPIREVAHENHELEPCPYPAAPINWILRYCAFANQTGDEIVLQQSECLENAQPDLSSKGMSCQIKEKYKLKYCQEVVEKHKTHKTAESCLEDPSIKPFFAGS